MQTHQHVRNEDPNHHSTHPTYDEIYKKRLSSKQKHPTTLSVPPKTPPTSHPQC